MSTTPSPQPAATPSGAPAATALPTVELGRSGITVPAFCLGGNVFGWSVDQDAAFAVLDAYHAAGGTFIDTADIYAAWVPGNSGGESETIIGNWIADRGLAGEVVVATKVGKPMGDGSRGLSRDHILRSAEASAARLRVETVDLYYAHEDDQVVALEETLGAFDELVRDGRVRAIGASNYTPARLAEALVVSVANNLARYEVVQPHYSLVHRAAVEAELRPLCVNEGLSIVPYYALASGFLTGKYRRGRAAPPSVRAQGVLASYANERGWALLDAMDDVVAAHPGATPAQVALAWLAAQPAVAAPMASATSVEQLADIVGAATLRLLPDEINRLSALTAGM